MKEYEFKFTEAEINYILGSLAKQPYIEVVELIEKIREQAQEQETNWSAKWINGGNQQNHGN